MNVHACITITTIKRVVKITEINFVKREKYELAIFVFVKSVKSLMTIRDDTLNG